MHLGQRRRRSLTALLLVSPALLLFAVFDLGPALTALCSASTNGTASPSRCAFIGLDNYLALLESDRFWNAFWVNWTVAIASIILQVPIALVLALALDRRSRFGVRTGRRSSCPRSCRSRRSP